MRYTRMLILSSRDFKKNILGKDPLGRKVIVLSLLPGRISTLCCNHCGGRLRMHSYHRRLFYDLVHDRYLVYLLPRLQCCNNRCPHHDHTDEHRKGATHMVFPSFIAPYEKISSQLLSDLAKAQSELDSDGCTESCRGRRFRYLESSRSVFIKLRRRYGNLWLYLREKLNTRTARRYVTYVRTISAMVLECYERACLKHFYSKFYGVFSGRAIHREFVFSLGGHHSLSFLIRFLLSYFANANATYLWWPSPFFWKKMCPYRET